MVLEVEYHRIPEPPSPLSLELRLMRLFSSAPVILPPANGNLVLSAIVILDVPSNDTPLMVLAVCSLVAVAALPVML